jgi:hypothetical protein
MSTTQVLITTRVGKYVWNPILQLIDWIPKGYRKATITISLNARNNTELGAMTKATDHMLKMLKELKKERNEASKNIQGN